MLFVSHIYRKLALSIGLLHYDNVYARLDVVQVKRMAHGNQARAKKSIWYRINQGLTNQPTNRRRRISWNFENPKKKCQSNLEEKWVSEKQPEVGTSTNLYLKCMSRPTAETCFPGLLRHRQIIHVLKDEQIHTQFTMGLVLGPYYSNQNNACQCSWWRDPMTSKTSSTRTHIFNANAQCKWTSRYHATARAHNSTTSWWRHECGRSVFLLTKLDYMCIEILEDSISMRHFCIGLHYTE